MARVYTTDEGLAHRARLLPPRSASTRAPSSRGPPTCAACSRSRSSACSSSTCCSVLQAVLPYSLGLPPVPEGLSFNTAVSFVTNTNWQSYSPELTMGYTVQLAGLAVQNFVSAAVGIAVAVALVRGFARRRSGTIGNFWVDLFRGSFRLLLPFSVVGAIVLHRRRRRAELQRLHGGHDPRRRNTQHLPGGPVASQEVDQGARHERRRLLQRRTPRTRSRTRPRGRASSRSCSCSPSRSRCRAPSAGWSASNTPGLRDPRRHGDALRASRSRR